MGWRRRSLRGGVPEFSTAFKQIGAPDRVVAVLRYEPLEVALQVARPAREVRLPAAQTFEEVVSPTQKEAASAMGMVGQLGEAGHARGSG